MSFVARVVDVVGTSDDEAVPAYAPLSALPVVCALLYAVVPEVSSSIHVPMSDANRNRYVIAMLAAVRALPQMRTSLSRPSKGA